jgi:hypothetical protein
MLLTFRRTGGLFALITLAAVAVATAVLTVAVAVTVVIVVLTTAAAVLVARAVLPRSWWRRIVPPATPWPHETIDATVVNPTESSEEGHDLGVRRHKG